MQAKPEFHLPPRNPQTHAAHRRETFWQITFPFIIALLLLLAAVGGVIWASVTPNTQVSRWADVSLIWLLLPWLGLALLVLGLLAGLVFLTIYIIKVLPGYTSLVQYYFRLAAAKIKSISNRVTQPVIQVHLLRARIRKMKEIVAHGLTKSGGAQKDRIQ